MGAPESSTTETRTEPPETDWAGARRAESRSAAATRAARPARTAQRRAAAREKARGCAFIGKSSLTVTVAERPVQIGGVRVLRRDVRLRRDAPAGWNPAA